MKTYCIIVRGDSYYKNRIKNQSCVILNDGMHNFVGLFGMYKSQNVGSVLELKKRLKSIAEECDELESLWPNGKGFEDNLIYYEIISRAEVKKLYNFDICK